MNRFNLTLAALLALQLAVAGAIYLGGRPVATEAESWALLDLPVDTIDRVEIVDDEGRRAALAKTDGGWRLDGHFDLPVDEARLDPVLESLAADQPAWPVATSAAGRARFKVAEDDFRKKVIVTAGTDIRTLYLGTSPNYRQVHVRRDRDDAVYGIRLDGYALAADPDRWLDRELLQLGAAVDALHGPGYALVRSDSAWQSAAGGGEPDGDAIDALARALAGLRIDAAEERPVPDDAIEIRVVSGESERVYRFFADGDDHFVRRDDFAPAFRIAASAFDGIAGVGADQLLAPAAESDS